MPDKTELALDEWVGVQVDGLDVETQSLAPQKGGGGGAAVKSRFIDAHRKHLRDEVDFWETKAIASADKFSDAYSMWKIKAGELALFDERYPPATDDEAGCKEYGVELPLKDSYWGRTFQHNGNFAMSDPFRPKRTRNPLAGMERAVSPRGTRKVEVPPPALERAMADSRPRRVERILPNRVPAQTEEKDKGCNPM